MVGVCVQIFALNHKRHIRRNAVKKKKKLSKVSKLGRSISTCNNICSSNNSNGEYSISMTSSYNSSNRININNNNQQ